MKASKEDIIRSAGNFLVVVGIAGIVLWIIGLAAGGDAARTIGVPIDASGTIIVGYVIGGIALCALEIAFGLGVTRVFKNPEQANMIFVFNILLLGAHTWMLPIMDLVEDSHAGIVYIVRLSATVLIILLLFAVAFYMRDLRSKAKK